MNLGFNLVCLLFFGYVVHSSEGGGGGKHDKVHLKIHVPQLINRHHHTKIVYIHKPVHKSEPKKPVVVHHHHHHKHDHGHKHKHGHNHGHKHDHKHKHGHKHKHQHILHHHGDIPHHHHHKKHKYIAKEHVFNHVPGNGFTSSHKSLRNENFHSRSHPFRSFNVYPSNQQIDNSYRVKENYNDYGTDNNEGSYQYPPLSSYTNPDAEYVTNSSFEDDSSENEKSTADYLENISGYSPESNYEYTHEPIHNEGYYDYEEETKKELVAVGPNNHVLVSRTVAVGDKNGRYITRSTELI